MKNIQLLLEQSILKSLNDQIESIEFKLDIYNMKSKKLKDNLLANKNSLQSLKSNNSKQYSLLKNLRKNKIHGKDLFSTVDEIIKKNLAEVESLDDELWGLDKYGSHNARIKYVNNLPQKEYIKFKLKEEAMREKIFSKHILIRDYEKVKKILVQEEEIIKKMKIDKSKIMEIHSKVYPLKKQLVTIKEKFNNLKSKLHIKNIKDFKQGVKKTMNGTTHSNMLVPVKTINKSPMVLNNANSKNLFLQKYLKRSSLVVGSITLTALLIYLLNKYRKNRHIYTYQKQYCIGKPNQESCYKMAKKQYLQRNLMDVKIQMSKCKNTKNPDKCKQSLQKEINDILSRIENV